ncbi:MAG TPA: hypothetical protein VHI13_14155 [Candidatus Kapabacteria bacterium]|nr:hypothetical protein [Candidatus Kapabacteria bacterium]
MQAQPRMEPAVGGGYEFGVPLAASRIPGQVNRVGAPGTGSSFNNTWYASGALLFHDLLARGVSPFARLSLALSIGRFTSDPYNSPFYLLPGGPDSAQRRFQLYSSLGIVQLDVPVLFEIGGGWSIGAGPWASYRLTSSLIATEQITAPDSVLFFDGTQQRVIDAGETLSTGRLRFGALFSAGLRIPLGMRLALLPELYGRLDAGSLGDGLGARAFSGGVSFALLFDLSEGAGRRDTAAAVLPLPPPRRTLRATIGISAQDGGHRAVIRPERMLYRSVMPLIPTVYFDEGEADLPERYRRMSPGDAVGFSEAMLARSGFGDQYDRILDIVGSRMRANTGLRIVLRGSAERSEPAGLARRRAAAVRSYLVEVWSVAASRIAVEAEPDDAQGRQGGTARSVALVPEPAELAAPVRCEWIVERWHAEPVKLTHTIQADAGLASWALTVRQGPALIARSTDRDGDLPDHVEGVIAAASGTQPLVAELMVEDSVGERVVSRDTLNIVRGALDADAPRQEISTYLFGGSREDVGRMSEELALDARDGAIVRISTTGNRDIDSTSFMVIERISRSLERHGRHVRTLQAVRRGEGERMPGTDAPTENLPQVPAADAVIVTMEQSGAER